MPQNADFLQKNDDISKTKMFSVLNLIWGRRYYKLGQLLQIRATVITNWDKPYYKLGQLLQIEQLLQIGA